MSYIELINKIKGLQTVSTIQKTLGISRNTAIKYAYLLRKKGFLESSGGGKQPRFYKISTTKIIKIGNPGLYQTINKYSPIKLTEPYEHRIIGKKLSVEEAIVRAVAKKEFRTILASLSLFNHIENWSRLYFYAKKYNVRKRVGALYELSRQIIKVRKIDKRIFKKMLNAKEKDKWIIPNLKAKDFQEIQERWKIYLPFNKQDLMRYKE